MEGKNPTLKSNLTVLTKREVFDNDGNIYGNNGNIYGNNSNIYMEITVIYMEILSLNSIKRQCRISPESPEHCQDFRKHLSWTASQK